MPPAVEVRLLTKIRTALLVVALWLPAAHAPAEPAPFDLAGPALSVQVTRGAQTLPIAEVPNLAAGDVLAIKAAFPADQSARYLLVVAFLRGATNPPPPEWFHRCDTWTAACQAKGLTLTVPTDAQQVLVFLAPATSGDFPTLVGAVRGRPGAFVRASQGLNQAALDRSRLEGYLAAIHTLDVGDRAALRTAAPLLARSLAIKVDEKCLDRLPELQAPCLSQGQDTLILNDGHSTSIVEALTSGPGSDLAMEASYTPQLGYGYYSPYIASILDIARIFSSMNSARYQYIPALAEAHGARLALALNTPPSFHDPKSVLVAALPAVESAQLPPLHAVDAKQTYCARKSSLVLPVEGAPLVFSTDYAHAVRLRLSGADGRRLELPVRADAAAGGLVVDTSAVAGAHLGQTLRGALKARWGFEDYAGPEFELVNLGEVSWSLGTGDPPALIVGREETVHLHTVAASCLAGLVLKDAAGMELKPAWKVVDSGNVEVQLPLEHVPPGALTLLVQQYGVEQPETLPLEAFAAAAHLESFALHSGDARGVLKGTRLDEVDKLVLKGIEFVPESLTTGQSGDVLEMAATDPQAAVPLKPGDSARARVLLKDGRTFSLDSVVLERRPSAALIDESVQLAAASIVSHIELSNPHDLPQGSTLRFSLRARMPAAFGRDARIEVATVDGSFSTLLGLGSGLMLEDRHVAVATLDPAVAFGSAAFGPLQFRLVDGEVAGDWQPLATLVRLPVLRELSCPSTPELACRLSGKDLFLIDAIAGDARFTHAVQVPDGFPGSALPVPHPSEGTLYLRLRDDPAVIDPASLSARVLAPAAGDEGRATARQAATPAPAPVPAPMPAAPMAAAPMPAAPTPVAPTPVAPPVPAAVPPPAAAAASPASAPAPDPVPHAQPSPAAGAAPAAATGLPPPPPAGASTHSG